MKKQFLAVTTCRKLLFVADRIRATSVGVFGLDGDYSFAQFPIVKYFPKDAGRYISAGIVVSEYNGRRNVSFHRMLIKDKDTIVIRLVPRHTFTLFNEAKKDGKELKISVCIGAPVEAMVSAALCHCDRSGIPHTESLACNTAYIGLSGSCPIESHIADDHIFMRAEPGAFRRCQDQLAS